MTQTTQKEWKIINSDGEIAFDVDSIIAIKTKSAAKATTFPVEQGSFANYNKVVQPDDTSLRLSVSGDARIAVLLAALKAAKNGTDLFTIITPRSTHASVTLVGYDSSSEAEQGATRLVADTQWLEVREVQAAYATETVKLPPSKVKSASSASKAEDGKVQGQEPSQTWSLVGKSPAEIRAHAKAQAGY